jgi:predicted PurR-regulated permease PerM
MTEEKSISRQERLRKAKPSARRVYLDPSSPSARSIVRVVLIAVLILSVLEFVKGILSSVTHLVFLVFLAVFFAYLIEPLVKIVQRPFEDRHLEKLMPRALAIFVSYVVVFGTIGVAISFIAPVVAEQGRQLSASFPTYSTAIQTKLDELGTRYKINRIPKELQDTISEKVGGALSDMGSQTTTFILNLVTYLPWLILIPILAFFFLKDANMFRILILRLFPSGPWRARAESVLHDVNLTLAAYARAQLISCVLIGTVCTIGFYIFGVNYALLLGVLAGIFEFIPLVGPVTIGLIVVVVAGLETPLEGLYVFLFLGTLRICQDYIFYPRIIRGGIHLHPLAVIMSVLAGEQVAGIAGVFISIPVVALLTVLHRHVLEHSGQKGILSGILEPNKDDIQARLVENQPVTDEELKEQEIRKEAEKKG